MEETKMKKALALLLVVVMVLGLVACGGGEKPADTKPADTKPADTKPADTKPAGDSASKIPVNMYFFTDEIPKMINKYMEAHPEQAEKYEINYTIISTTDGLYEPALDQALANGEVDMYAAEAAFVLKYTQGDASQFAATYEDLGIDVDAAIKEADIAQYTIDIGSRDGKVVGLGYQATGGAFIYRRSIAKDVWGSDDPAVVEEKIGAGTQSWDKFFEAAADLKAKGYKIVSGDGDIWHAIENSSEKGWIEDGALVIDPAREAFLDLSKKLTDEGYSNITQDWQEGWYADMKGEANVFGFYGPAWLINYVMAGNSGGNAIGEGSYGDWAVCAPNVGFFWGGTWVLAGNSVVGTEKQELIKDIIYWITLDATEDGLQYKWANGTEDWDNDPSTATAKDTVGSGTVMAMSNGELEFLGGQNMFDAFVPANAYANGKNLTQYDQTINDTWRDAVRQYAAGEVDRDTAIENFKTALSGKLDIEIN